MGLHTSFDRLSEFVEHYERNGHAVRHIEVASDASGGLEATLEVPVSLCGADSGELTPVLSPTAATLTDEHELRVEFTTAATPALPPGVSVDNQSVRVTSDGEILLTVTLRVDGAEGESAPTDERRDTADGGHATNEGSSAGGDGERSPDDDSTAGESEPTVATGLEAVRDDSVPPYDDTAYLRALYDACDTFEEMSQVIEMDVAAETVRRYMIDAGVHTPTRYETSTDDDRRANGPETRTASEAAGAGGGDDEESPADAETPTSEADDADDEAGLDGAETADTGDEGGQLRTEQLVTDGLGLPDDLRIEDVVDAVAAASTVYEVQRHLGLETQYTWELLQQLDLLDLLVGRVADGPDRPISHDAVMSRIRQRAANGV